MNPTPEYYQEHKEKESSRNREWWNGNPEKTKGYWKRSEAKRKEAMRLRRDIMLAKQGGVCAVCGTDDPGTAKGWQLDHDHSCCDTKGTRSACGNCDRGVLCQTCNRLVVAMIERYPDRIVLALRYLGLTFNDLETP